MSAVTPFTIEAAKQANFQLIEAGSTKGRQAVHDMVVAMQANRRSGTACAKNRSEVSGSNKKLWRQKGTGRARVGSVRSPIWVGGGVVFGPRPRDYSKKVNRKVKRLALRKVLTERIASGDVYTIPSFQIADGKTKTFLSTIASYTEAKKVLVVGGRFDETTFRAARNVQPKLLMSGEEVNVEQLLHYDTIILTDEALVSLASRTN